MRVSVSWLREWVEVPWPAVEIGSRLTMAGIELEAIAAAAPPFAGVVVAAIVEVAPHPQADKLRVCKVDAGSGTSLQIVCGAANARAGLRVALATVGARLPGGLAIEPAKLRGVESAGMLCSASELGLAETAEGLLELPTDAPLGMDLRDYLDLDDSVLELAITPNRGDAMSVLGVAREVSALAGLVVRGPAIDPVTPTVTDEQAARIEAKAACGRLLTRVIRNVDNARASPPWLRERLRRAGQRSISPVVDCTNYVMLELGQPMHAFDASKLRGRICARLARPGETVALLDGREVALQDDVLVIADDAGAIAMAGVMGGARTMIESTARDVVLEVAWFDPAAIAGRGRRYGLTTDASQRFERGVDPLQQRRALERATALLLAVAGGAAGPIVECVEPGTLPRRLPILLRRSQLPRLLGMTPDDSAVERVLRALGLEVAMYTEGWSVTPPAHRFDLAIERDLIEEYARIAGYDSIPETAPQLPVQIAARGSAAPIEREAQHLLAARGYSEAIHYAFVDDGLQRALFPGVEPVALSNPISSDLSVMRVSLWPGLIGSLRENLRRQQSRVKLFEIGVVFGQTERVCVAGLFAGSRNAEQWAVDSAAVDFFDVRADVEALLAATGDAASFRFEPDALDCLHPGRAARVLRGPETVGWIGELHPSLVKSLDLTYPPVVFEFDVDKALYRRRVDFAAASRFPEVRRDLAIVVDEDLPFSAIHERVTSAGSALLHDIRVFDVYRGAGVEPGRKSVAIGLIFQEDSRTLADDEADRLVAAIRADLTASLGARIRE